MQAEEIIKIPKGVFDGLNLRSNGKGNQSNMGANGDLLVKVKVKPHEYFVRDGDNILSNWYISVADAILGGTEMVSTVHGSYKVKIQPGTVDGTKYTLKKQGINMLPPNEN